jgi:hypothetical protein
MLHPVEKMREKWALMHRHPFGPQIPILASQAADPDDAR